MPLRWNTARKNTLQSATDPETTLQIAFNNRHPGPFLVRMGEEQGRSGNVSDNSGKVQPFINLLVTGIVPDAGEFGIDPKVGQPG